MSYYKYSSNDLLDGNFPYNGIFRVENETFLKGYDETEILKLSNNFIGDFYQKEKNFSNIFNGIEDIEYVQALPFDTINKQYFDKIFDKLNDNNLTIFKSLVSINSEIFDRKNVKFYTLSSANNSPIYLTDKVVHSDPFESDSTWYFLDNIVAGDLLPTSEGSFKYLCSNGTELISLSGSFDNSNLIILRKFELEFAKEIQNISYNEKDDKLQILSDDEILIYDALLYKQCDNLILLDKIKLLDVETEIFKWTSSIKFNQAFGKFSQKYLRGNPNNPDFIKFGDNYRTTIDNGYLFIMDKYSARVIDSINLSKYEISDLITMNIRKIDDKIAILHRKYKDSHGMFITYISTSIDDVVTQKLENILDNLTKYDIEFCNFDSDLIFISNNNEYQIRSIENTTYPLGKISQESFKYLPKFKFGNTYRKFENPQFKWSSTNMDSNNFNYKISSNTIIGDTSYHIIVSTGRFYVIKQKIDEFYKYRVTRHISKEYDTPSCSKSSFGLYLNDNIFIILNDLINLQNQSHCKYTYNTNDTILKEINDLIIESKNVYLHTNEKIHALNFQRILQNILKIQKEMISISNPE